MTFQKIILVGNLGRNPELRYSPDGTPVCNFSMATNRKWAGKDGEQKEQATWWRISAWNRLAETCNQYLTKGGQVLVEGRMNVDPETGGPKMFNRSDGSVGTSFEVVARSVKFLGGGSGSQGPRDEDVPPEAGAGGDIAF